MKDTIQFIDLIMPKESINFGPCFVGTTIRKLFKEKRKTFLNANVGCNFEEVINQIFTMLKRFLMMGHTVHAIWFIKGEPLDIATHVVVIEENYFYAF